jgi:hypothetical protein
LLHQFEAFQFLSRKTTAEDDFRTLKTSPKGMDDLKFEFRLRIEPKPFELDFIQLKVVPPSIGAHQWIDPDVDRFLARRWPLCFSARGQVEAPDEAALDLDLRKQLLMFPRTILWTQKIPEIAHVEPPDQRAIARGYRREYFTFQMFDIDGKRRPSQGHYFATETGEPIGPGVVTFRDWRGFDQPNEFAWSPILPFQNPTKFQDDQAEVTRMLGEMTKHYNSNSEYEDAERHLRSGDVKAAVRSLASAVDAIVRYYRRVWNQPNPPGQLPFDEKIDDTLQKAGRPTYKSLNPSGADDLRYLYRCRNSMHEGDCYYNDDNGVRIEVRSPGQVEPWIRTVGEFIVWIDSLA